MVKAFFNDLEFKEKYSLGAVNSINWARVLAQVVYYVYAWLRVTDSGPKQVCFSVPTGNFGDIFAGYVAKRMGLPIGKLLLATNENNILTRFVNEGDYSLTGVVSTVSPSMDIQVASNFERYLYHLYAENPEKVRTAFADLREKGQIRFSRAEMEQVHSDFCSTSVDQNGTLETIGQFYRDTGYMLDPHTAVGVRAALELFPADVARVCLATAHPAKFGEAVEKAIGAPAPVPEAVAVLEGLPTRCDVMDADLEQVRAFIIARMG
jgi:threonine synthase